MTRKLDALFAERVLEWEFHPIGECRSCGTDIYKWTETDKVCRMHADRYTQSLDAAWEGVENSPDLRIALETWENDDGRWYKATAGRRVTENAYKDIGFAPIENKAALAVVRVLLLAYGVTGEEIRDAESL